ncbi:MAG: hypothetical protein IJH63_11545 [Methanobrevibacter sp.]|nr:hypothetical protein [Methanobrevibacter sp.]
MEKLNIIIIILIAMLAILSIGIIFTSGILQHQDNMKTIALSNTCTINVTESDTNITLYADTIKLYNDTKNGIEIISYNSQEAFGGNGNALGGAVAFAGIRDSLTVGENIGELNGFALYKCDGYYSAKLVNNVTHDNIVIVCKDLDLLKKIVSSAKFTNNGDNGNNSTDTQSSKTSNNTTSDTTKPAGVSDEEWQAHLDLMEWRESNPYAAEDGSRYATIEERNAHQAQISGSGSSSDSGGGSQGGGGNTIS